MPRKPKALPREPENDSVVEKERAKTEGKSKGTKHVYKSPAAKERSVANLLPKPPAEALKKPRATYRQTLAETVRAIGNEEVEVVFEGKTQNWKRVEMVVRRLFADAASGKTAAAELVFERGWGKVPSPVVTDIRMEVTNLIETTGLTIAEISADPILRSIAASAGIPIATADPLLEAGDLVLEGEVLDVTEPA